MKKKILNIGLAIALMFSASSCENFLDINENPNTPRNVTPELVFPAAVTSTAGVVGGDYAILGGIWSQHWTQNPGSAQYRTVDAYNLTNLSYSGRWSELYSGALNDYKYVRTRAVEANDWNLNFMATVMEAYTFQVLADLYDRIPFEEALRGDEGILSPQYQGGEEVYNGLIARINEAMAKPLAGEASGPVANNDVVFGGDMESWTRFANTLKLKLYMRQSEVNPGKAQQGVASLYSSNAEFLNTSAMEDIFEDQASKRNPLYEQDQSPAINSNQNLRASWTIVTFLQDNNDPRIDELFQPGAPGAPQRGLEQGWYTATTAQAGTTSRPIINPTEPVYFISEAESYFLQAEAVMRGWGTGSDKALYDEGVRASFRQLGLTDADANTLLAGDYAYPTSGTPEQKLQAIITQKWIALAGTKQGIESFFERNRTNIPKLSPLARTTTAGYVPGEFIFSLNAVTSNRQLPRRLIFPQAETTRNTNAPAIVPLTTPVWWDVNGD